MIVSDGQEVFVVNNHFGEEVWVVEDGELVSTVDLPPEINTTDGTARRYIEEQAGECGLVAVQQKGEYVFRILRKS